MPDGLVLRRRLKFGSSMTTGGGGGGEAGEREGGVGGEEGGRAWEEGPAARATIQGSARDRY